MTVALAEDYHRNATPPVWPGRHALCLFCSLGTGCGITRDVGLAGRCADIMQRGQAYCHRDRADEGTRMKLGPYHSLS
jgi:hypothetical protein